MVTNSSTRTLPFYDRTETDTSIRPKNIKNAQSILLLKRGIWAYFFLLIFEGALRKWLLPDLASAILIIRDPVAFWIIFMAWKNDLLKNNGYLVGLILITTIGTLTALVVGHGNLIVALFGARIFLLHFPLIFIIGRVFNPQDVLQLGRITLWISIPMTVLITMQFYSPQSAWVNRGVGGDMAGAGFSGALGFFRPPGTFSFTNGTTLFYTFLACFVFYFWYYPKLIKKPILWLATASLLVSIPVSISRGLLFQVVVIAIFAVFAGAKKIKNMKRIFSAGVAVLIIFLIFSQIDVFQTGISAFLARFENASSAEGGLSGTLGDRYLGGLLSAITSSDQLPFWGFGLGMGTNVGSKLISGEVEYLIAEGEWGRMVGELGALLGLSLIYLRLALSWELARKSYRALQRDDLLPWVLLGFMLTLLPQGNTAQPTSLGFIIITGGILLAAVKIKSPVKSNKTFTKH